MQQGVDRRCAVRRIASLPSHNHLGCRCCCVCFGDLAFVSEKPLEMFGYHCGWASLYDLSHFVVETDAAKIRKAPHPRQENIDDEPFDVRVCALGHGEVCDESRITCGAL